MSENQDEPGRTRATGVPTPIGGQGIDPATGTMDPHEQVLQTEEKSYSQGQLVLRRFLRHKAAMISLVVLAGTIVLSITSLGMGPIPGWWDKSYVESAVVVNGGEPTLSLWPLSLGEHPFGQDNTGKDYFALVMRGSQISLMIAFSVGILSSVIGTTIGVIAGYFRGWLEALLMRITDLFIVIPLLVLAAALGRISGGGPFLLSIMLGLVTWTSVARLVRGEVLSLRERDFVLAARAVGANSRRIIFKHLLPNTVGVIIVSTTLAIAAAILLETSLSFLGFGVQAPDTSLGKLISDYQNSFTSRPWLFWWPGVFILLIALTINFLGDGLRDAFDPRQQRNTD